ncbi:hypothetical protein PR202_ga22908 [Eleusine coracana subsp. coracana]|uniref:NmrA-like domain-containing protein n=1 Tax=Eleusine coracana subsp. coracana TaxID=191504 RepID=A0AAV5D5D9_ELECO|nr:hypothetical protein PR202_ga22908 [Eleusine coracana subsp. coracana]
MLSSILVIGGTGMIGQHLVMASLDAGHPTAVLLRPSSVDDPGKARLVENFKTRGAIIVYGDINNHEGLVRAIKQADVVISAVGHTSPEEVESQLKIVAGMQEAGNVRVWYCSFKVNIIISHGRFFFLSISPAACSHQPPLACYGQDAAATHVQLTCPPAPCPLTQFACTPAPLAVAHLHSCEPAPPTHLDPATSVPFPRTPPRQQPAMRFKLGWQWRRILGKDEGRRRAREDILLVESQFPLNFQLAVVHWTLVATKPKVHEKVTGALAGDEVEATELYPELKYITVEEFLGSLP